MDVTVLGPLALCSCVPTVMLFNAFELPGIESWGHLLGGRIGMARLRELCEGLELLFAAYVGELGAHCCVLTGASLVGIPVPAILIGGLEKLHLLMCASLVEVF